MATKYNYTKIIKGKEYKYFRITRVVGQKANGTPIVKEFLGDGEKDANKKADEYMNKLKNGYINDYEKVNVLQLMKTWLFNIKLVEVKPSTFVTYESNYRNYISKSELATMKVADVKKIHIQKYYNELFEKQNCSTEKIKAIHKLLHSFFEYALDEGYLIKNPCSKVIIPKNNLIKTEDKQIECFDSKEIELLKKAFESNKYRSLVYTAIYTGMREGELCALKWKNVNLKEGFIHVDESVKRVAVFDSEGNKKMKTLTLDPKTKNSIRNIYIPEVLINELKNIPHKSDYVFSDTNEPVSHKSLYFQWRKVLKENDIPHRKFHALRHTYGTLLLANGADLKSVQDLMGHYDISITQTYLHSLEDNKKNIVSIWDKL